jgi:hypothetical protein
MSSVHIAVFVFESWLSDDIKTVNVFNVNGKRTQVELKTTFN